MRLSHFLWIGLVPLVLTACEREEPVPMGQPGDPMYTVDPDATGPLTFAELRVNFTALDEPVSNRERRCVKKAIERLAQELGDPATYRPEDYDYHGGHTSNAQWQAFNNREQRGLLAQVVVTYAFMDCT
ncbi:MAG: hypothetical protein QNJ05_10010 [Woeseiaceae bacterium]|nr:hypothetical protein [Woeseiaceae bacterium]